jgi:hypothetical protein
MTIKIATFISITAFALFGAIAQGKVFDPSKGQHDFSDHILPHLIDQTPYLYGCEVDPYADSARSSADPSHQGSAANIFTDNFDILDENLVADSCAVPIPRLDPFRNVARR